MLFQPGINWTERLSSERASHPSQTMTIIGVGKSAAAGEAPRGGEFDDVMGNAVVPLEQEASAFSDGAVCVIHTQLPLYHLH